MKYLTFFSMFTLIAAITLGLLMSLSPMGERAMASTFVGWLLGEVIVLCLYWKRTHERR